MFSKERDAFQVALAHLVEILHRNAIAVIDLPVAHRSLRAWAVGPLHGPVPFCCAAIEVAPTAAAQVGCGPVGASAQRFGKENCIALPFMQNSAPSES